jgi:integrase/recombinase XerD
MIINDAINHFFKTYFSTCDRSPKTLKSYEVDLRQLKEFIGPDIVTGEVSPERLQSWARQLRERGYRTTSIRRKFAVARVFFGHLVRCGEIQTSPFARIRLDLGKAKMLPRNLSESDAQRLLEEAWRGKRPMSRTRKISVLASEFFRLRNIAIVEILFATGMRVGELIGLRIDDWRDTEACFIVNGKGATQRLAILPDERSTGAVRAYLGVRASMKRDSTYLFLSIHGHRLLSQGVSAVVRSVAQSASIPKRVTPHMIRHTVATLLLTHGADIRIVQEVLGHASILTTQRYLHVSKELLRSVLLLRHPTHYMHLVMPPGCSVGAITQQS